MSMKTSDHCRVTIRYVKQEAFSKILQIDKLFIPLYSSNMNEGRQSYTASVLQLCKIITAENNEL
jgi:hypothetical protein